MRDDVDELCGVLRAVRRRRLDNDVQLVWFVVGPLPNERPKQRAFLFRASVRDDPLEFTDRIGPLIEIRGADTEPVVPRHAVGPLLDDLTVQGDGTNVVASLEGGSVASRW